MQQHYEITPQDLERMVRHWLNTPAGAYLGSPYGSNIKNTLQRPMLDTGMDQVIQKLMKDVPLLTMLGPGAVNIYEYQGERIDTTQLFIELKGLAIEVPKD